MTQNLDFLEFPKMARLSREMIITEKKEIYCGQGKNLSSYKSKVKILCL